MNQITEKRNLYKMSCGLLGQIAGERVLIAQWAIQEIKRLEKLLEQANKKSDPAIAAIQFALSQGSECSQFLRLWNEGEFGLIRREWPDCPDAVFIGADPLYTHTKSNL